MKALVLEGVQKLAIKEVPTPQLAPLGALIRIQANGVCRSDWHAWMGDIPRTYPMVLGHEMAGIVEEVAPGVRDIKRGDRVVVPFNGSDGTCPYCQKGLSHLCDNALIPGRSYSGDTLSTYRFLWLTETWSLFRMQSALPRVLHWAAVT